MAEANHLQGCCSQGGQRNGGQGIGIIYHQSARTEFLNVAANGKPGWRGAQVFEDASWPDGIGDTLIHAVFQGNGKIIMDGRQTTDFDSINHIIANSEDAAAIRRRLHGPGFSGQLDQLLGDLMSQFEAFGIQVYKGKCALVQSFDCQDIGNHFLRKRTASGTNESDFDHAFLLCKIWDAVALYYKTFERLTVI